jgi:chitin disaccharide deacetylase
MNDPVLLIINADDFGQSDGVNEGIIHAHEQGVVTSASLMVRGDAAVAAATYAKHRPQLSVGLHIDLGEWTFKSGEWLPMYAVVPLDNERLVHAEIHRQLEMFRNLLHRNPTHIDSHQHVHRHGAALSVAAALAEELHVPLRHCNSLIRYCGHFYGQPSTLVSDEHAVSAEALVGIIGTLSPGITELACHPGCDEALPGDYVKERLWETRALCSREVKAAIQSATVRLCSFDSPEVRCRPGS